MDSLEKQEMESLRRMYRNLPEDILGEIIMRRLRWLEHKEMRDRINARAMDHASAISKAIEKVYQ